MKSILGEIVDSKRHEVAAARERVPWAVLERRLGGVPPARDLRAALLRAPHPGIIAEIKKASPSAGVLRDDFDPLALARAYMENGAHAISVLTDGPYFQGDLAYLSEIRRALPGAPPLLRKDFIIDAYQVVEARAAGADAVLLIAEILEQPALVALLRATTELGMHALVELHEAENLERVLDSGAAIVGINNRDLRTFETRLDHTLALASRVPKHVCLVSESGIRDQADMRRLHEAGVGAVLIGETFMRARDIAAAFRLLRLQ